MKLLDSQTTLSPTRSQTRSFERWKLKDILDRQRAFGDGKAGLEAEAEGGEPCGSSGTDGEESQELEKTAVMASLGRDSAKGDSDENGSGVVSNRLKSSSLTTRLPQASTPETRATSRTLSRTMPRMWG